MSKTDSSAEKRCSRCRQKKPRVHFFGNRCAPDGLQAYCKTCTKASNDANRDRRRLRNADPVIRAKNIAYARARYRRLRSEYLVKARAQYAADPSKPAQRRANRADAYREYSRNYAGVRRARKLANGVEKVDLREIARRDGMRCHICGRLVSARSLSFDHLTPISRGGSHAEWNLAVAHLRCNMRRGVSGPAQLRLRAETV